MGAGRWFGIIMVMVEVCLIVVWELVFSILYCRLGFFDFCFVD